MKYYIFFFFVFCTIDCLSQKIIDKSVCDQWPVLQQIDGKSCMISNDGKYIVYQYYSNSSGLENVLLNIHDSSTMNLHGANSMRFSNASDFFVAALPGDSLLIKDLNTNKEFYSDNVRSIVYPVKGIGSWIGLFTAKENQFVIRNIKKSKFFKLGYASFAVFNENGNALLVIDSVGLKYVDINRGTTSYVANSEGCTFASFDHSGNNVAFVVKCENSQYKLLYYSVITREVKSLFVNFSANPNFRINDTDLRFSEDGETIFFSIIPIPELSSSLTAQQFLPSTVSIWSYQDKIIHEKLNRFINERKNALYSCSYNLKTGNVNQLEDDSLHLESFIGTSRYCLLSTKVSEEEYYWSGEKKTLYLLSLQTGNKIKVLSGEYPELLQFNFLSTNEKFVLWYNGLEKNYYAYQVSTGKIINITAKIKSSLSPRLPGEADLLRDRNTCYGVAGWLAEDEYVLIYDRTDIWLVDPTGVKSPTCITNHYGAKENITFRLSEGLNDLARVNMQSTIWMTAFDNQSKRNGFFKSSLRSKLTPQKCLLEDAAFFFYPRFPMVSSTAAVNPAAFAPVESPNKDFFIVRRMTSQESPNLYLTRDFVKFQKVTHLNPELSVKWMNSKLLNWKLSNGVNCQGILHVPENFDSSVKYPLIFNYYQQRSEGLNVFKLPELAGHNINIPWYVNRGYLVFELDFYYERNKTAQSIIEIATSAVNFLSRFSFVDIGRLGIQGQSHGGYETNILATGTNLFAAACEMAGYSNIISEYSSLRPGGFNNQSGVDIGQRNLGDFPWINPKQYIDNSPVFHIANMTTPLLMIHNRQDAAVLFPQALELYMFMRRAGKRVWLLEYQGEGHQIVNDNNKLDYTLRMQQFFDFYLKGAFPPKWMTGGLSPLMRESELGFKLDSAYIPEKNP